jgi:acetyl-CoA carboxylase carboxyl transferase subunit alpha
MDLKELEDIPKSYLKEILQSLSKIEKLKKIPFFTGIHFKDAEKDLIQKVEGYKRVERDARRVWKIVELSRNEKRPQCRDYIDSIFENFVNLCGDRLGGDDKSIITGLGKIDGRTVAVIGHNKGKDIKERMEYNFGMSLPQGYRKSQRVMKLADRFGFPIITFIDTPGAYPAIEAEDNGQAGAIAKSISVMFEVKVPVIAILIGEGGSGGALALAIGNEVAMLENSTYSVISPEGCAAILWKNSTGTKLAARELRLTSRNLRKIKVIDKIIPEPFGGAQNAPERMIKIVRRYIIGALRRYDGVPGEQLKSGRAEKFESMGFFNYG